MGASAGIRSSRIAGLVRGVGLLDERLWVRSRVLLAGTAGVDGDFASTGGSALATLGLFVAGWTDKDHAG